MNMTGWDRLKQLELGRLMLELLWEKHLKINKYRLLDLVDGKNDATGNWKLVANAFEDLGGNPKDLYFTELQGDYILIALGKSKSFV